ncbi:MAG: cell division protein FtsZ [Zymomonas mobilis subsp. pomaceae]|uniref:Cell division protein FtsZ n=1 Tax=Zymomonas mobilis subsp. pomaceae (strain ATCC 29192 / DSM 22645 / JCM 10191 / CCUG 17912 / NBRC 13757 / NCIMB 11200 / NRRL B-4491 / Barker I) TaxID=579138 RepID=F8EVC2_ZYMMT|nr:cell division protein FtsZ [Zymomonas mobilis]AEI37329.1 cell division protein FtsZ [Zymomonas mobilis subsp. pomaceae ATCC 29192]MDX5948697.1 cell division protein FtsZ [Zymomonas mobilis subsp. pomaceae]GEB88502.1 cell division protein FtsZ [Zymomonas mobilis subsp. pomaceae]
MTIEFMRSSDSGEVSELPRISVIGVGGGGGNAVANMIASDVQGVDFIVANTDAQALNISPAAQRIQLGPTTTQGLGAGSRPEVGKAAAEETIEQIQEALEGARMCFIAAGMGGGTGTGAAPVIAKVARDRGILTVGVVTKPFNFEGKRRARAAETGIEELQKHVDTLIVIPNQNLFLIANPNTTFKQAFEMADEVLQQGVRGITDLMVRPGLINLDFADIRSVMSEMGKAMMGTGEASGDNRAIEAAEKAIANPLLDGVSMNGARGVIVSIIGGDDMTLMEMDEAANHIRELVDEDANIIFGSAFNEDLDGRIRVSVVATGIDSNQKESVEENKEYTNLNTPLSGHNTASSAPLSNAQQSVASQHSSPRMAAPQSHPVEEELLLGKETLTPSVKNEMPSSVASPKQTEESQPSGWSNEPNRPAPRLVREGSTLFERMSNIARGTDRKDNATETRGRVDIPQFLNRQGN